MPSSTSASRKVWSRNSKASSARNSCIWITARRSKCSSGRKRNSSSRSTRGVDLQSEHERYLTEKHAKKPVVVMNYPKAIKAFYMRVNDDGRTVAAMDVLALRIGEIIGGSQREERLEVRNCKYFDVAR